MTCHRRGWYHYEFRFAPFPIDGNSMPEWHWSGFVWFALEYTGGECSFVGLVLTTAPLSVEVCDKYWFRFLGRGKNFTHGQSIQKCMQIASPQARSPPYHMLTWIIHLVLTTIAFCSPLLSRCMVGEKWNPTQLARFKWLKYSMSTFRT